MATAPLINNDVRIVSLSDADPIGLDALFDEQCREWLALLRWDYTGPSRMIRQVVRQGELAGFVAVVGARVVGFTYYVVENDRCSIGDIYTAKEWRDTGIDRQMVAAVLDALDRLPHLIRIESQCVSLDNNAASELFLSRGFEQHERLYMLAEPRHEAPEGSTQPQRATRTPRDGQIETVIRGWQEADFAQAARVIHQSYRGRFDSRINCQYATEDGCAELLTILTDHIWCGDFLPHVSRVAVRRGTRKLTGVLIASRIAPRVGHIGQVAVHHAYQGQGIGRELVTSALAEFVQYGFSTVSLAVTATNSPALRLYESLGFHPVQSFPVFFRETPPRAIGRIPKR